MELLENELKNRLLSITDNKIDLHNVFKYFFDIRGKRLRPILVLLSAGLVRKESSDLIQGNVIKAATVMELIHNSSLIHDDIIDESSHRRGQATLNHKFNNKIAVLAGDLLYSHAFLIMNKLNFSQVSGILSGCVEKMCRSEIKEIISPYSDFTEYIGLCDAKTADLMSACCKCGALISNAKKDEVTALGNFGTNFGIAYQLTDDFLDDEQPKSFDINLLLQAKIYGEKAKKNLAEFADNEYKKHLLNLVQYVTEKAESVKLEKDFNNEQNKQKELSS